jgi:hypothetical protein
MFSPEVVPWIIRLAHFYPHVDKVLTPHDVREIRLPSWTYRRGCPDSKVDVVLVLKLRLSTRAPLAQPKCSLETNQLIRQYVYYQTRDGANSISHVMN